MKCAKCGKRANPDGICRTVLNAYPYKGFPHDTVKHLCKRCKDQFCKDISKWYEDYFEADKGEE